MSKLMMESTPEIDDALLLSVVDEEFRAIVAASPDTFGLPGLPDSVEPQEQSVLTHSAGSQYIAMCASTCSKGPFTVICDGSTK